MAKKGIHPKYYHGVQVTDINGNSFTVNSTVPGPIKLETSYLMHPTYTGEKVSYSRADRVEKFKKRMEKTKQLQAGQKE